MKCRDIYKVDISKSSFKPMAKYDKTKPLIALDTETENGECFLLGMYSNDSKEILESNNADVILNFLNQKMFKDSYNFFYNLTYDFQAIIKTLPMENLKELSRKDRTIYKNFYIKWIPNKMFAITDKNKKWYSKFFDLMQYFNYMKLDTAGSKFLNYEKIDLNQFDVDITKLSFDRYKKDIKYRQTLRKYLFRDCEITFKLSVVLYDMILPYMKPKYFYSQASFSQQYFLENVGKRLNLPDKRVMDFGLKAYQGGRFEVFKRGRFNNANIYDIKSAYPYHTVNVPDTSKGKWKEGKEYDSEALISLYNIDVEVHDIDISPLKYQLQDSLMIYPIGQFKDIYVNKNEYKIIDKLGYKIKVNKCYHYYDKEPEYPFTFLEKFYNLKEKYKQEGKTELSWIPKIILNGFYGKLIQIVEQPYYTKEYEEGNDENLLDIILFNNKKIYEYKSYRAGVLFNPVIANEITANTRCQLFNSIKNRHKDIIGFQTDSIITEKRLNLDFGDRLGQWESEKVNKDLLLLGSGVYQFIGEENKTRVRGFRKNLDLFEMFNENLDLSSKEVLLNRNYKLKKTIKAKFHSQITGSLFNKTENEIMTEQEKYNVFNRIIQEPKTININFDRKRVWDRNFKDFKDVLNNKINSKPIVI